MRQLWKLKKYFWKYKFEFITGIIFLFLVNLLQLVPPKITGHAINSLEAGTIKPAELLRLAFIIGFVWLGVGVTRFMWRYFLFTSAHRIERDLRDDFYRHVLRLPASFFTTRRTGDLMALSSNDILAVRRAFQFGFIGFTDSIVWSSIVIYMMLRKNVEVTALVFIPMPIITILFIIIGPLIHRLFMRVQESFAALTTRVEENITGIRVVRSYVQEKGQEKKFQVANEDYRSKNLKLVGIDGMFHALMFFLPSVGFAILLMAAGTRVISGEMMLGDFIEMNMYLGMLIWPMIAFGWLYNLLQRAGASVNRLWEIFDEPDEYDGTPSPGGLDAPIEFRNLTFTYPDSESPALRNLSFKIDKNETVSIMGRTGSGKSTIIGILLRLYDPPRDTVFVGGTDILDIPKKELRSLFAVAPQEAFLFSDSIGRNIAFADVGIDDEEIMSVARSAQIYDEIIKLPDKFDTIIGERGVNLSGGQRQRTAIARALVAGRKIMILDDPLSAVDTVTENGILGALRSEVEGRTVMLITHRVNAAAMADRIVVLDKGTVVEQGTEAELLAAGGIYRDFYERQKLEEELGGGNDA